MSNTDFTSYPAFLASLVGADMSSLWDWFRFRKTLHIEIDSEVQNEPFCTWSAKNMVSAFVSYVQMQLLKSGLKKNNFNEIQKTLDGSN